MLQILREKSESVCALAHLISVFCLGSPRPTNLLIIRKQKNTFSIPTVPFLNRSSAEFSRKAKTLLQLLAVLCFPPGFANAGTMIDTTVLQSDLAAASRYTSWDADTLPENPYVRCEARDEFRVCATISEAELVKIYPKFFGRIRSQIIVLKYTFFIGTQSTSSKFEYMHNSSLPDIHHALLDDFSDQLTLINDQLIALDAPPIHAIRDAPEPTYFVHSNNLLSSPDIASFRAVICADFKKYFTRSLDGKRYLQRRLFSIESLLEAAQRCKTQKDESQ